MPISSDPRARARRLRRRLLQETVRLGGAHLGGMLSAVELLAGLYDGFLRFDPAQPAAPDRDRFILSKGHAGLLFYLLLNEHGLLPAVELERLNTPAGVLTTHPEYHPAFGIEATTGSLGHGLALGCGLALGARNTGAAWRTVVLLGDGECQEGSVWEAVQFAAQHRLTNLLAMVDHNGLQALQPVGELTGGMPLTGLWQAGGWSVREIDGHDPAAIAAALAAWPWSTDRPGVIIAHTVKGKGVSFMERMPLWHYRCPSPEEMTRALAELAD